MKTNNKLKKSIFNIKILDISLHEILWYFILFSVAGLLMETFYCYQTTGVLESRKGLIFGPFCPIYGIGATFLIISLNKYKKNSLKLFIYGFFLGSILEYFMSFVLEVIYGTRFWDYSYLDLNLNGRISLIYSLFWGILSIFLMSFLKPLLDKLIFKISNKLTFVIDLALTVFFIFDIIATIYSLSIYKTKAINTYYNLPQPTYNAFLTFINNNIFSDSYIMKSFPNIRFIDNSGKEIFVRDILN